MVIVGIVAFRAQVCLKLEFLENVLTAIYPKRTVRKQDLSQGISRVFKRIGNEMHTMLNFQLLVPSIF